MCGVTRSRVVREGRSVIVLVNRRLESYRLLARTFLPVLRHWKFPHRLVDVTSTRAAHDIQNCAVVLLIQPDVGKRIPSKLLPRLDDALARGVGLFIADPSLIAHPRRHRANFMRLLPHSAGTRTVQQLEVVDHQHFVAASKRRHERLSLGAPVGITRLTERPRAVLRTGQDPVLFFLRTHNARIAFCAISPRSLLERIGFGTGLDVLYWKSVVYVAKKPFAQMVPPRFATFRIEDCVGEGDFRYLDDLVAAGFRVHLGLDLNDFVFALAKKLRRHQREGKVEFSAHSFTHYKRTPAADTELIYADFSGSAYSPRQMRRNVQRLTAFQQKARLRFSPVLTYHYGQLGSTALRHLKRLGVRYLVFPFLSDVRLDQVHTRTWRCWPFGKLGLVCDRFPDDPHFWVIGASSFPDTGTRQDAAIDVSTTSRLDFLFGLRLRAPGKHFEQYADTAERVWQLARAAYDNLFFANLFTHETLINYLEPDEFHRLVRLIAHQLEDMGAEHVLYQDLARYFHARFGARITSSGYGSGTFECRVRATMTTPLHITMYSELGDGIQLRTQRFACTRGRARVLWSNCRGKTHEDGGTPGKESMRSDVSVPAVASSKTTVPGPSATPSAAAATTRMRPPTF